MMHFPRKKKQETTMTQLELPLTRMHERSDAVDAARYRYWRRNPGVIEDVWTKLAPPGPEHVDQIIDAEMCREE